jgi:hypothetical protein
VLAVQTHSLQNKIFKTRRSPNVQRSTCIDGGAAAKSEISMKLEILGLINNIGGIKPTKNGFQQIVVLHIPEVKDELERVSRKEQYYPISIWSKQQTDSRFLSAKDIRSKKKRDFYYNIKLNLSEWGK